MGFNTWNLYGCRVTADILVKTAQSIHSSGLQKAGYQYVNSDDCVSTFVVLQCNAIPP